MALRLAKWAFLVCLLLFLVSEAYLASLPTVKAQSEPSSPAFQKLLEAFRGVQEADSARISQQDSSQLVQALNVALDLHTQALLRGNTTLDQLSTSQSTNISLQAGSFAAGARSRSLLTSLEGYGVSIAAASLTALLAVDSQTIVQGLRRRKYGRTGSG